MASSSKFHKRAIVIGASLGGLLTARALSEHFEQVTLIEKDGVHLQPESRKGQPQTRHLHGLLATGLNIMTQYYPDLPDALEENGAFKDDFAATMRWYAYGGYRKKFKIGFDGVTMSRPLLEHLVRQRTLSLPNLRLLDNTTVRRLAATPDNRRVTGVVVERDGEEQTLSADLVVDVTGRGSRTPQWLKEMGYDGPPQSEVHVNVGYATRLYRRDPDGPGGKAWHLITPDAPHENRFGGMFPIEGDRWIVSVGGWHGDHAPTDEQEYMEYVRSLPAPDIYNAIRDAEPLSDIISNKFPFSMRRHYEKLSRFPLGYLVLGDAASSFNPTYGQGMTSAALQVVELDRLLSEGRSVDGLAAVFFKRVARILDIPWQLAVGEDFRFPKTTGPKPFGIDLLNRYVSRVHRATHHDEVVGTAFLKVMSLMEPPTSLMHPTIMWRVLTAPRTRSASPAHTPVGQAGD